MREPELWTRCPEARLMARRFDTGWWCTCHGFNCFSRVPDGAVERTDTTLSRILSDAFDLDGHVTDVVNDSEWRREALREFLAAAVGGEEQ